MKPPKCICFYADDMPTLTKTLRAQSDKGYRVTHYQTVLRHTKKNGEKVEYVEHYVLMEHTNP